LDKVKGDWLAGKIIRKQLCLQISFLGTDFAGNGFFNEWVVAQTINN
jgi:hypothetical protein